MRSTLTAVAAVVLLSACGAPATSSPEPGASATEATATPLAFSAPLVGGGEIAFEQFAGTTVALWFWAPT